MTLERVEEIKEELQESVEQRTRAKVKMEDVEASWKEEFGVSNLEEAENKKEEIQLQLNKLQKKEDSLEEEIEQLLDQIEEE